MNKAGKMEKSNNGVLKLWIECQEGPKCRNRLSLLVSKEIDGFIANNNLHIKYLEAKNGGLKKTDIIGIILERFHIENYPKNRHMICRRLGQMTFKDWSCEEKEVLEDLLRKKINTAVWNELGNSNEIKKQEKNNE